MAQQDLEPKRPLYARCASCMHRWVAVYLPQPVATFCRIVKNQVCPKCGGRAMVSAEGDSDGG